MIDINAYLGHFAFRPLRYNTADELLRLMDRKGIERAAVSSATSEPMLCPMNVAAFTPAASSSAMTHAAMSSIRLSAAPPLLP